MSKFGPLYVAQKKQKENVLTKVTNQSMIIVIMNLTSIADEDQGAFGHEIANATDFAQRALERGRQSRFDSASW